MTTSSSARIARRLLRVIDRAERDDIPIAEIWRMVGVAADRDGCTRPSYAAVRRHALERRRKRDAARESRVVIRDAVADASIGRFVDPYDVLMRLDDIRRRR